MNRNRMPSVAILGVLTLGVVAMSCKKEPIVGGYTEAAITAEDVAKAAEFAVAAQSATIQGQGDQQPSKLQLLKILKAEQQVVAGINFRITLSVQDADNRQRTAEAIVWWQAWRPKPYELTSWTWK